QAAKPLTPKPAARGGSNQPRVAVVRETPVETVMDPTRVMEKAVVAPPVAELPPGTNYRIGTPVPGDNIFGSTGNKTGGDPSGRRGTGPGADEVEAMVGTPPPPVAEKKVVKQSVTRSMGVVNGMAISLPKPVYSAIAKAAHAAGVVNVQVLIDEQGKVVSARAMSGHPLLQREAVQAALQARFSPTLLSQQPVKVSGVITYNFVRQ
ncbi:MAG TPA: energy transducer TonB, partial [Pyrinomonadaceae bacterium]|nr:energy transducer TonB [Pyrinomonadaceae bacterium]